MNEQNADRDRLLDLMADRAVFGLAAEEQRELNRLQERFPDVHGDSMDRVATLIELSSLSRSAEPMPAALKERLRKDISDFVVHSKPADRQASSASVNNQAWRSIATWAGWALAACLLFALVVPDSVAPAKVKTPAERRVALLESSQSLIKRDWQTTEDKAAASASGDVVWNNEQQEGYMRFEGLKPNDPSVSQYQLWIFDDEQEHPVDGGVFDIPAGSSEVIIPIQAKIRVSKPTTFAITIEKPGGVVVSKQERVPLLAPPS